MLFTFSPGVHTSNFTILEAFLGSPYLQAIGLAGTATSFVPLATAQIVGASVSTATGFVSAAVSYTRTRAFVRSANETLFEPRGLQLRILSTRDMTAKIGRDGDKIQLPRLSEDATTADPSGDPRMRWLGALEGSIAPLDWDVPAVAVQENWLKKPGAWQARRQEAKKTEKLDKERKEAREDVRETRGEVTKRRRSMDKEIAKLHGEMLKVEDKAARETRKKGDSVRELQKIESEKRKEIAKIQKEIDKEMRDFDREDRRGTRKIDKAMREDKEQKKVQNIRWMVITQITAPIEDREIDAGVEGGVSE